jgi:hypothetical protein
MPTAWPETWHRVRENVIATHRKREAENQRKRYPVWADHPIQSGGWVASDDPDDPGYTRCRMPISYLTHDELMAWKFAIAANKALPWQMVREDNPYHTGEAILHPGAYTAEELRQKLKTDEIERDIKDALMVALQR